MLHSAMGILGLISRLTNRRSRALRQIEERVACFREILKANNSALGTIARIQEYLDTQPQPQQPPPLTHGELQRLAASVTTQTYRMVINLERLTGDRHKTLRGRLDAIKSEISHRVEISSGARQLVDMVVPLARVGAALADIVGQKSAFLGEARRILGGHVPDGFAITAEAYRAFLAYNNLGSRLSELLTSTDLAGVPMLFQQCNRAMALIENAEIPPELGEAIKAAAANLPHDLHLAVRSSALQEGGAELSFAGQYRSLLNVTPAGVVDAFKRVIASKYSPEAVTYRQSRGFADGDIAMCCCVLTMVDAAAAGVLYSSCRSDSGARVALVQAVRGLGLSAVDGSAEPDSFLVDPVTQTVVSSKQGLQTTLLQPTPGEGTVRLPLVSPPDGSLAITGEEAVVLAQLAWKIQSALESPIDMEWAVAQDGTLYVLQVRPQPEHAEEATKPSGRTVPGYPVLFSGGCRASRGAGCGLVAKVQSDLDIIRFEPGRVLVARDANPRLAVLLPSAAALVTDYGETTGHLATVARELKKPALLATRSATSLLADGALVTVDADGGVIYAGRVDSVLSPETNGEPTTTVSPASIDGAVAKTAASSTNPPASSPTIEALRAIAGTIVPLTIPGRLASGFSPRQCRTLHDVIRFCHQRTIEAMFAIGDRATRHAGNLRKLVSPVAIDCRLLDLGGGLVPDADEFEVGIDQVVCVPMRALWKGMTDPRLGMRAVRKVSVQGFMSSIANFGFDEDARVRGLGEPSYAFVTAEYLSLNSRIGYHFATIDARIDDSIDSNYASFRFVGGSTGVEQRSRRAILI
ncbi:MAG: PEP/pyruvate-binding domain-containing protein, partial [Pseudomonadota bacterium]